ncbi:hypothetical protein CIB48_g2958 [Xylaria polymorpha]|nr:hypothetical protein CIB48_g2958 [Xylaria polymorpha]
MSVPTEYATSSLLDYKYEPLPKSQNGERWIRVLDLFPSTDKMKPLKADFALYAIAILLKKARDNLVDGLRVSRLANQERTLWMDSLCINQEDRDERSQQVGMMGLIFWLAECVLIWLADSLKA